MNNLLNCSPQQMNISLIWSPHVVLALGIPQMITNLGSVIFNFTVIIEIAFSKNQDRPILILFCSLAISDLLVSLTGFWISVEFIIEPNSTIYGSLKVLVAYTFYTICILSTIYNLVSIGIERYLSVSGKTLNKCGSSKKQVLSSALIIWVAAVIFGSLPLMGWHCLKRQSKVSTLYGPFCVDYLLFITIPNFIIVFVLPLMTYIGIILKIRKQKICMQAQGHLHGTYRTAEVQVAKTCIFIWLLALISYAPFLGGVLWDVTNSVCPEELQINIFVFRNLSAMMITLNSIGNPIIYTLRFKSLGNSFLLCNCRTANQISALSNPNN